MTMRLRPYRLLLALTLWMMSGLAGLTRAEPPVIVFAAASLKEAMDEVAERFQADTGVQVSRSYGGSSALARQIQYGAPAQVFVSANAAWMDVLQGDGLLVPGTRRPLLANRLVLIGGADRDVSLLVEPDMDLLAALNGGRLAMALVDAVPAGIYGRAALVSLGVWDRVQGRIAQTDNVRAALRLVAVGEAPLGIVYATDAAADPRVRVLGVFPSGSHPPILYPVARLKQDDSAAALAFYDFLRGPQARAIFQQRGFGTPAGVGQ
jgi:molybdate transport system substrate-binding protein